MCKSPQPDPSGGPHDAGNGAAVAAATLIVLTTLALVAYLVTALPHAAPIEIAEIIAAAGGLLAGIGTVIRALRDK